jgi:hypothetical protein
VEIYFHAFLTSALDGGEWSTLHTSYFAPGERAPDTHWIGDWVGPRATLDMVMKRIAPFITTSDTFFFINKNKNV